MTGIIAKNVTIYFTTKSSNLELLLTPKVFTSKFSWHIKVFHENIIFEKKWCYK